ncbi:MAG: hypothetical protein KatS3mg061_0841 [Dehalococcoidia bacterium]|nr:MAG: hypothetical protein KatS3mg061_0841 [Dehalococcoidia bacterium]
MFRLKSCVRCGGDLWFGRGLDGPAWHCLQCGRSPQAPLPVPALPTRQRRPARGQRLRSC